MSTACEELEHLLVPFLSGTLDDASLVRAQAHLEQCQACQAMVARWRRLRPALQVAPSLSPAHADRLAAAIMRGLDNAPAQPRAVQRPKRNTINWLGAAGAAAAVVLVATAFGLRAVRPGDGRQDPGSDVAPSLAALAPGDDIEIEGSAVLGVARVQVPGVVRVHRDVNNEGAATLRFANGEVAMEVTPLGHRQSLSLCSPTTCVRVIGTAFTFRSGDDGEQVQVTHGLVAVSPVDAGGVEIVLSAGERFNPPWSQRRVTEAPAQKNEDVGLPSQDKRPCHTNSASSPVQTERCMDVRAPAEQWFALAEAYASRHRLADARRIYAKLVASDDVATREQARYAMALLLIEGNDRSAAVAALEAVRSSHYAPLIADACWRLANIYAQSDKPSRALPHLSQLIAATPTGTRRAEALFLRASIEERDPRSSQLAVATYTELASLRDAPADLVNRAKERLRAIKDEQ